MSFFNFMLFLILSYLMLTVGLLSWITVVFEWVGVISNMNFFSVLNLNNTYYDGILKENEDIEAKPLNKNLL